MFILKQRHPGLNPLVYTKRNIEAKEELYDLKSDPEELKNLASNPDYSNLVIEMREKLERKISKYTQ